MKIKRVVEWLFFFFIIIICCNNTLIYSLSTENSGIISSSERASGHDDHVKPSIKQKQLNKNVFKSHGRTLKGLNEARYLRDVIEVEEENKAITDQNKKGKGSYGGGDLLRPRGKKSGANSSLLKPSSGGLLSLLLLRIGILGLLATIFF
ncbi:hypothetical protein PTKIN_Ptkin03bG0186200 [Pterospermum kingtungense]